MSQFQGTGGSGGGGGGEGPDNGAVAGGGGVNDMPNYIPISNAKNSWIVQHDLSMLLRKLLLRIFPKHTMKTEIASHGLKTEPGTPDELLASEGTQALTVRPSNLPFAKDNPSPRNLNPRRSLRVSR